MASRTRGVVLFGTSAHPRKAPRRALAHRLAAAANARRAGRRNNDPIQAATPISGAAIAARADRQTDAQAGPRRPAFALRALGSLGLLGAICSVLLLSAGAATRPSIYVPGRSGGWPSWMAGPLEGLDVGITKGSFQTLTLIMCASYVLVLLAADALSMRAIAGAILAANVALLLGPPLLSQDVFGYIGFARMGALHGLDPYTRLAADLPSDPIFSFLGWPFLHSPYGPLFTLASYATAPLGIAGALWTFKAVAVASTLGALALIARAAGRLGHSARWAVAFVGLNPVMLSLALGGAHNDALVLLLLAAALALTATAAHAGARALSSAGAGDPTRPGDRSGAPLARYRAGALALAAGVGIKVTAGVVLPFLVLAPATWRERARTAGVAVLGLALVGVVGVAGFGVHALGFLDAVGEQQQLVASHSVPAETARLLGMSGTPGWWRHLFLAALWRCSRWRCGEPRAAPTGAWPRAGRRSRCWSRPPGCCPGMRSGRCR